MKKHAPTNFKPEIRTVNCVKCKEIESMRKKAEPDPYINQDTWDVTITTKPPGYLEGLLSGIMMLISALFYRKPQ